MSRRAMMVKAGGGGGGGGGSVFNSLTIDPAKIGSADLTDFALLVKGTYPILADVAHGGSLNNVNNLSFYADAGFATLYKFERLKHDLTTGDIVYRVKVPSVSHTVGTVVYPRIDTSNTTDLSDPTNVYKASIKRVYHTGDGTTLSGADATANAGNATIVGATAAAGKVWGAAHFTNASNQYLENAAAAVSTYPLTLEALVKLSNTSIASGDERVVMAVVAKGSLNEFWLSYYNNPGFGISVRAVAQSGGPALSFASAVTADLSAHHLAARFTNSTTFDVFYDGAALTGSNSGTPNTPTGLDTTYLGGLFFNTSNFYGQMQGDVEEARIHNVALSASEILATANNQLNPAAFYAVA